MHTPLNLAIVSLCLTAGLLVPRISTAQSADTTLRIVDQASIPTCRPEDRCGPPRRILAWQADNRLPHYPEVMHVVGIDGEVELSFVVDANGRVADSTITITRITNSAFERTVRDAVTSWHLPLWPEGEPVGTVKTELSINFALLKNCPGEDVPRYTLIRNTTPARLVVMRCRAEMRPRH